MEERLPRGNLLGTIASEQIRDVEFGTKDGYHTEGDNVNGEDIDQDRLL